MIHQLQVGTWQRRVQGGYFIWCRKAACRVRADAQKECSEHTACVGSRNGECVQVGRKIYKIWCHVVKSMLSTSQAKIAIAITAGWQSTPGSCKVRCCRHALGLSPWAAWTWCAHGGFSPAWSKEDRGICSRGMTAGGGSMQQHSFCVVGEGASQRAECKVCCAPVIE